jgi:hypothetical protein
MIDNEIRELLAKHESELARAEQIQRQWAETVEALRQVVAGYRRLLKASDPRQQRLEISGAEVARAMESSRVEVEHVLPAAQAQAHAPAVEIVDGPRGEEAVRQVLSEEDRPRSPKEITEAIVARGWIRPDAKSPEDAVRAALGRMRQSGKVMRVGTGLYALARPEDNPAAHSNGGQSVE